MLSDFNSEQPVYLATGVTDMRKSIDGLAALVQVEFALNPFSPCLFVFCNRQRNKLKILHWNTNGFWIHYRRLERGRFEWPQRGHEQTITVSRRELNWLLDGLSMTQGKAHRRVNAKTVI